MTAYYNEVDPYAAQWLRNLIAAWHVAAGDVDERSILDVSPRDLRGYVQCHFFAGIGGWSLALRLAGWPDDRPVWTGSCPCQPLSSAGLGRGHADERHLWPAFHRLIAECRPAVVFGEQVASKDGREWFAAVRADLERLGYACGAADLPAASVGAPHIRQRLWFVAQGVDDAYGRQRLWGQQGTSGRNVAEHRCRAGLLAVPDGGDQPQERAGDGAVGEQRATQWRGTVEPARIGAAGGNGDGLLADADAAGRGEQRSGRLLDGERAPQRDDPDGCGQGDLADAMHAGRPEGRPIAGDGWRDTGFVNGSGIAGSDTVSSNPWSDLVWLPCSDGKARPTQPGLFPLAHGVPQRVGRLRAYGNAIIPQVAAEFIRAVEPEGKQYP